MLNFHAICINMNPLPNKRHNSNNKIPKSFTHKGGENSLAPPTHALIIASQSSLSSKLEETRKETLGRLLKSY